MRSARVPSDLTCVAPQHRSIVEVLGLGSKRLGRTYVGGCAEFHVANRLLLHDPSMLPSNIGWVDAVVVSDGGTKATCWNCQIMGYGT